MTGRAQIRRQRRTTTQRGFTLVTAVFLITILFLLSAYLISFTVQQQSGVSLDALGTRAFAAARAGAEWGAYQALRGGGCASGTTSIALGGTLATFTATVTLTAGTFNEAGTNVTICTITSNACNQPTGGGSCPNNAPAANYVERQITSMVGQ